MVPREPLRHMRHWAKHQIQAIIYWGDTVTCPCCNRSFRGFLPKKDRPAAQCPGCGSLERHRLIWLYLQDALHVSQTPRTLLHVAPEPFLKKKLSAHQDITYVSCDIIPEKAATAMDLTAASFKDNAFDIILCCHVLEHIDDDNAAMRELNRILKPEGWSIIQTPIDEKRAKNLEGNPQMTPEERLHTFGHPDHRRIYGREYKEQLERAGFSIIVEDYISRMSPKKRKRHGLMEEKIYRCTKTGNRNH